MRPKKKDLLSMRDLSEVEISLILETADSFKDILKRDIKKVPTLRGKTIINLFYEPSTRTRSSFEIAGKFLSADVINFSISTSSASKGETFKDTAKNLAAMAPDILVVRHSVAGVPHLLAPLVSASIINAGDGAHEHPTQALLDMMTIKEYKGKLKGLKVSIIGDISHSRVAMSNIIGLTTMKAEVTVCGPPTCIPPFIERLGAKITYSLKEAIVDADVIMMLRIQLERGAGSLFPTLREYSKLYGLTNEKLKEAKKDVIIMHPGPLNRGIEIDPEVADGPHSVILNQVTNGVAVRMALLYLYAGGGINV